MIETEKLAKILDVISNEILPLTESEVESGSGVLGGAILRADTMTSVMVGASSTAKDPLAHGEMDALTRFFNMPVRPDPSELIFVATHEPCPMCAGAIAVAGFRELWVFNGVKDAAAYPANYRGSEATRELYGVECANSDNAFFTKRYIRGAVEVADDDSLRAAVAEIDKRYASLAAKVNFAAEEKNRGE